MEDGADAVDDGHEAGADGLEDGLDLCGKGWLAGRTRRGARRRRKGGIEGLTQDTTAPILRFVRLKRLLRL